MIEKMMDDGENILWTGRPNKFIYILGNPIFYIIAIFWAVFDFGFILVFKDISEHTSLGFLGLGFILLHMFPVWLAIFGPIYRAINYHTIEYAITDRRSYIGSGIFGKDITVVEHRFVENLTVNVGFLENMFKVGSIRLTPDTVSRRGDGSRVGGCSFRAIEDPYEVYKLLKKISLDVTTDQEYPNAYRPEENPGYKTKWKN